MKLNAAIIIIGLLVVQPVLANQEWNVTWENDTVNQLSLHELNGSYTGIYINDNRDECDVTGNKENSNVSLLVKCSPSWTIEMSGTYEGNEIHGTYVFKQRHHGSFRMFTEQGLTSLNNSLAKCEHSSWAASSLTFVSSVFKTYCFSGFMMISVWFYFAFPW